MKFTPSQEGEYVRLRADKLPKEKKTKHVCNKPPIEESEVDDVWECFTCNTRWTHTEANEWLSRWWPFPRHKHRFDLKTGWDRWYCRCGKFGSIDGDNW